jgi:exonuclease VII small subunit
VNELFSSDMSGRLAYIKSNFVVLSKTIARLEAVGVEMNNALDIVKSAQRALEQARGKVAENVTLGEEDPALDSNDVTLQIRTLDVV